MRVSLIIPVYNEARFLKRCLDSVKNQNVAFDEVIIIDDCSTDDSFAICKQYKDFTVLRNEKNCGVSYTRNKGIKHATGDYITFLDSDDELTPNACEVMKSVINEFHDDIFQFNHYRYYKKINKTVIKNPNEEAIFDIENYPLCNSWWGVWNKVIRKDSIKYHFENGMNYGEDGLFVIYMLLDQKKIHTINICTTIHHFENEHSLTHSKTTSQVKEEINKYKEILIQIIKNDMSWKVVKNFVDTIDELYESNIKRGFL